LPSHVNLPDYRTLLTTVDGGVATITLNRPRWRNAFGDGMRDELADAFRTCDRDDSVRVIVLTGAVNRPSPNRGRVSARPGSTCPHGRSPSR
jgi:1,4-dihydroxy-2-naphthoyl-CoA synthase